LIAQAVAKKGRVRERSDGFERKAEALKHALNLLLNNGLVAFHTDMTQDGTIHDFLFGIASGAPIENPFRRMLSGGNTQDFPIVLWRTKFEPHGVYAVLLRARADNTFSRLIESRKPK
jgi:hypothetical protein